MSRNSPYPRTKSKTFSRFLFNKILIEEREVRNKRTSVGRISLGCEPHPDVKNLKILKRSVKNKPEFLAKLDDFALCRTSEILSLAEGFLRHHENCRAEWGVTDVVTLNFFCKFFI